MSVLNSTGGPANSTLVMSQKLFSTAFSKSQFGLACAMGVVLAAITLIFSALVFLVNRLTGGSKDVSA
jgi:N-acetylglucosamine transport system permease protein